MPGMPSSRNWTHLQKSTVPEATPHGEHSCAIKAVERALEVLATSSALSTVLKWDAEKGRRSPTEREHVALVSLTPMILMILG